MNKIDLKFKELKEKNQKVLIPFIALGDKSLDETVEIAQVLEKAGADIVELGIPFSDPLADGPIIQDAYHRALTSGINVKDMIKTVENITSKINIPVIIMVYYNVVYCKGVEKFLSDLENAGVSGVIVPDVPLEEREELLKACENNNIALIPLVAPTSKERINKITSNSKGFVYCVSHAGTTGEQNTISSNIKEYLQEVKNNTDTPICVGFGISSVETAGAVKEYCDGVIIGSAIVRRIGEEKDFEERKKDVYEFVKEIKSSF